LSQVTLIVVQEFLFVFAVLVWTQGLMFAR
jgi:uncharacterized membrane protein